MATTEVFILRGTVGRSGALPVLHVLMSNLFGKDCCTYLLREWEGCGPGLIPNTDE